MRETKPKVMVSDRIRWRRTSTSTSSASRSPPSAAPPPLLSPPPSRTPPPFHIHCPEDTVQKPEATPRSQNSTAPQIIHTQRLVSGVPPPPPSAAPSLLLSPRPSWPPNNHSRVKKHNRPVVEKSCAQQRVCRMVRGPLSSEYATHQTVKPGFWPWRPG